MAKGYKKIKFYIAYTVVVAILAAISHYLLPSALISEKKNESGETSEAEDKSKEKSVDDFEIVQIQASHAKKLGEYNLMQGDNPVMICSFNFVGE